jgi:hypothetical protein
MNDLLREDQIEAMTQELDEAIEELDAQYGPIRVSRQSPVELLPAAQRAKLEQATGETAAQFWPRFKHAAHDDICKKGGFIHDQWQKFQDIARKDLVKVSASILAGMGIAAGGSLLIAVVPAGLWIFTALSHIGIQAFCDEA